MEIYRYTAKNLLTEKLSCGEIEGGSIEAVRRMLAEQYLYPISIRQKKRYRNKHFKKGKLKLVELDFFCRQFAAMLEAGVSMLQALRLCEEQSASKILKKHLNHIQSEVSQGKAFSKALEEEKVFPPLLVHMAVCGEVSGNLSEVMRRLAAHFESRQALRKKALKALAYPCIVLGVMVIVVAILMMKVVPSYVSLLKETGAEIPFPTQLVLNISIFLAGYWELLLVCGLLTAVVLTYVKKQTWVKKELAYIGLKLPVLGGLKKKSLSADFSSTMSILIQSGIPMLQAMEITKNIMGHAVAEEEMNQAIEKLKSGKSLYESVRTSSVFSALLPSMIKIGEEAGNLDEMLAQMSRFFKEQVEAAFDYVTVLIEPALIIIISLLVGGIMAAVMLPTFSAATSMM